MLKEHPDCWESIMDMKFMSLWVGTVHTLNTTHKILPGKGVIPSELSLDDAIAWIKNSKTKNLILILKKIRI